MYEAVKQHEKDEAELQEAMGKQRDKDFDAEFKKAKTLEDKDMLIYTYYGEKAADDFWEKEIHKELIRGKKK